MPAVTAHPVCPCPNSQRIKTVWLLEFPIVTVADKEHATFKTLFGHDFGTINRLLEAADGKKARVGLVACCTKRQQGDRIAIVGCTTASAADRVLRHFRDTYPASLVRTTAACCLHLSTRPPA